MHTKNIYLLALLFSVILIAGCAQSSQPGVMPLTQSSATGTENICGDWPGNDNFWARPFPALVQSGNIKLAVSISSAFPTDVPLSSGARIFATQTREMRWGDETTYFFCDDKAILDSYTFYIRSTDSYWNKNDASIWHTQNGEFSESEIKNALKENGGEIKFSAFVSEPETQKPVRGFYVTFRKASGNKTVLFIAYRTQNFNV